MRRIHTRGRNRDDVEREITRLGCYTTGVSSEFITLTSGLFILQNFHRLFLRETETRNTGASENVEGAGQGRLLQERVAAIQ